MKRLVFLLTLIILAIPTLTLAKGPFSYITIKGPGITGDLSVTNSALLDFFAFADFSKGEVEPPATPGEGYEIIRSFVDENNKVQNFDLLYYYPDSGYVYYDGLIGDASSEYDGKWYTADPNVESKFRAVLAERARLTWIPFAAFVILLIIFGVAYFRKTVDK
jgi:hypothetical protein